MKKLLVVSAVAALGLSTVVFAGGLPEDMPMAPVAAGSDAGFYLGVEGGYDMTHYKNLDKSYEVSKDNGFAGRAFLGYDINKQFAVEFGYSYFFNKAKLADKNEPSSYYTQYKTQAFDLFGKGKLPITDEFGLYAKLGVGYLMTSVTDYGWTGTESPKNFNVAYGAGMDYSITSNIIANVEWLRYNGNAKLTTKDYQPNADAFMVGLRYKFDL